MSPDYRRRIHGATCCSSMAPSTRNIVWIASYPKSGNTWVRFLACNLLFGPQESATTVSLLAPDIHEAGPALITGSHAGLVKTHFAYSSSLPLLNRSAAAIYVVRHPADVLVSNFYYAQRRLARQAHSGAAFDEYFDEFVANRGDPQWQRLGMGSWEENVRSWLGGHTAFPVVVVRYEDLSANAYQVAVKLAQFLKPTSTEQEVRQAIEDSSFSRMREIEEGDIRAQRVGIFYKPYLQPSIEAGNRFMREGAVGSGARHFTAAQRTRLIAAFGPLLVELRYDT